MNKGNFYGLLYREIILVRKKFVWTLVISLVVSIICILVSLSYQYGNLALLKNQLEPESFVCSIQIFAQTYAIIASGMICFSIIEESLKDTDKKWDCFRRSTPVSSFRFMLAKYTVFTVAIIASYCFSILSSSVISIVLYSYVTAGSFALSVVGTTAVVIISLVSYLLIIFYKSLDKAMFTVMCILLLIILPLIISSGQADENMSLTDRVAHINNVCCGFMPYIPPMIIALIPLSFASATMLCKRRER